MSSRDLFKVRQYSRMRRIISSIAMVLACALIIGCSKPSVEGETKKYTANVDMSKKYQELYPGFASAMKADADKAAAIFKEAEGMTGEEAIAKMQEANKSFGQVLMTLQKIESTEDKIKEELDTLDKLDKKGFKDPKVDLKRLRKETNKVIDNKVDWVLKNPRVENDTQALDVVNTALEDLEEAGAPVKSALETARDAEKKANKAKNKNKKKKKKKKKK